MEQISEPEKVKTIEEKAPPSQTHWLRVVIIVVSLLLLTIGFLIGFLIKDKSCEEDPLAYGVQRLNKLSESELMCSCSSYKLSEPIRFNANGIIQRAIS